MLQLPSCMIFETASKTKRAKIATGLDTWALRPRRPRKKLRERGCPRVLAPVIESKQKVQIVVLGELRLGMKLLANLQQKVCACNQRF